MAQLIILLGAITIAMAAIEYIEQAFGISKDSWIGLFVAALVAAVLVRMLEKNLNWKRILS